MVRYVTGIHALNIPCELETCGDWHQGAIQWQSPFFRQIDESVFGNLGIESGKSIPGHQGEFFVANHIRALLDLLELGQFSLAQGMRDDYIANNLYTRQIFEQVSLLRNTPIWPDIDTFMGSEYYGRWLDYKEEMAYE